MEYTVNRGFVFCKCPRCNADLKCPIGEAGTSQKCSECGSEFTVPGVKEREAKEQQDAVARRQKLVQEAREKQQRQQEEAARQQEEAARQQQRAAAAKAREAELRAAGLLSFTDRFLAFSFAFAKGISVLVLIVCFLSIVGLAIAFLLVRQQSVRPALTLVAPTMGDYFNNAQNSGTGADVFGRSVDLPSESFKAELRKFCQNNQIPYESISHIENDYATWLRFSRSDLVIFFNGLEEIAREAKKTNRAVPVGWYYEQFVSRWAIARDEADRVIRQTQAAELEATTRRLTYLGACGATIAILLSFLFLPLCIQIERNTRKLNAI